MIIKCVDCGQPVSHEADIFCYQCGRKSELESIAERAAQKPVTLPKLPGRKQEVYP